MNQNVIQIIRDMIENLDHPSLVESEVIIEGSPVVSFGSIKNSKIATLGLNPSDKEFFDSAGEELIGQERRFHTLSSLNINIWKNIKSEHLKEIYFSCEEYFLKNPYDRWFKSLNYLISGTGCSYYDFYNSACHLDLVPYATRKKWGNLSDSQKRSLLELGSKFLAQIINEGAIEILVLNGKSVVSNLEIMAGCSFLKREIVSWNLPRKDGFVRGESYTATLNKLGSNKLNRSIKILGFNHNIQSSFGVTSEVKTSIKNWISREVNKYEKKGSTTL